MASIFFKGGKEIKNRLLQERKDMQKKVHQGMLDAAIMVRRDMEKRPPVTPVDLGNLKASFYIVTFKSDRRAAGSGKFKEVNKEGKLVRPKGFKSKMESQYASSISNAKNRAASASKLTLIMGYAANYSIWVHEMPPTTNWSKPMSGPKWFESALKRNRKDMLTAIGISAKITLKRNYAATKDWAARSDSTDVKDLPDNP